MCILCYSLLSLVSVLSLFFVISFLIILPSSFIPFVTDHLTINNNPSDDWPTPIKFYDDDVAESDLNSSETPGQTLQPDRLGLTAYKDEQIYLYIDPVVSFDYALCDIGARHCRKLVELGHRSSFKYIP